MSPLRILSTNVQRINESPGPFSGAFALTSGGYTHSFIRSVFVDSRRTGETNRFAQVLPLGVTASCSRATPPPRPHERQGAREPTDDHGAPIFYPNLGALAVPFLLPWYAEVHRWVAA